MPLSHGRALLAKTKSGTTSRTSSRRWRRWPRTPASGSASTPTIRPWPELAGIPRCIFSSFDGYQRALDLTDSPNVGVCLCVGCWLEGGPLMGKDVVETIHDFGRQKRLFKVHFRNVDQPLPHFVETFIDDGYMDM